MKQTDFIGVLAEMKNGEVLTDLNAKFNELLEAVFSTSSKGSMTIKVLVKPTRLAMGGTVVEVAAEHECIVKKPELALGASTFFVTKEGVLSRNHPGQDDMFNIDEPKEIEGRG